MVRIVAGLTQNGTLSARGLTKRNIQIRFLINQLARFGGALRAGFLRRIQSYITAKFSLTGFHKKLEVVIFVSQSVSDFILQCLVWIRLLLKFEVKPHIIWSILHDYMISSSLHQKKPTWVYLHMADVNNFNFVEYQKRFLRVGSSERYLRKNPSISKIKSYNDSNVEVI